MSNNNFRTEERIGLINIARWQGQQSPSHYNPINLDKVKNRSPQYSASKVQRFKDLDKRDKSPSPQSYFVSDSLSSSNKKQPRTIINKDKNMNFMTSLLKKKKSVPSVAKYDI